MGNNESGEFELVVGNRQLLSGFFIIVLLFAVAFAMGYVVGQNSPRSSKLEVASTATPVPTPVPVAAQPASTPPPAAADAAPAPAPVTPVESTAPPAGDNPAAAPSPPGGGDQTAAAAPADGDAAGGENGAPALAPGPYWQVAALPQADAELIASSLKAKGFPVVLMPAPGPRNLTRVLVGPYPDQQTLGKAKTDLESVGFRTVLRK